jgi:predicted ATPase/DNA-binding CsgD family transcriptional regulator/DNA-binding XRE family transcriptional regulator
MVKKSGDAIPNRLLQEARKERGWTQKQVADLIGAPRSFNISRWETGTAFPSAYYVQKLCRLFSKSTRELGLIQNKAVLKSESHPKRVPLDSSRAIMPLWTVPTFFTSLVGREQDVEEVCELLRQLEVRLLTLVGTGGVGKTRLALQVATEMRTFFADGVCFVPLAAVSDPFLVMPTIAEVLNIHQTRERPLFEQVKLSLRDRRILLILDNFEQVAVAALQVEELLATCSAMIVIITSRTILHLQAEQVYTVSPLALPPPGQLLESEALEQYGAVSLFLQRARSTMPSLQLTPTNLHAIAEICRHLDGLPLAIELAAARVRLLPPQALLSHLKRSLQVLSDGARTLPERQKTLHNSLKWSYELLSSEEQCLFRRLSVFSGGWTLDAAEAIWTVGQETEGSHLSAFEGVAALLDKSLLLQVEQEGEEPRLQMLVTVREYGQECLQASGEDKLIRYTHAMYYLELTEAAQPTRGSLQGGRWFARLSQEHDNLRAAMSWLLEREETEMALRLGGALREFWEESSSRQEGWQFLERALAGGEEVAGAVRAKALNAAGSLAVHLGDPDYLQRGAALCEQSLALFREIGDTKGMGDAVYRLAIIDYSRADWAVARSHFEECIELSSEAGDKDRVALSLNTLGAMALWQGEFVRGRTLLEESLAFFRELGNILGIRESLFWLAVALFWQGDLERAHILVEECLALNREMDLGRIFEALPLAVLGEIKFSQSDTTTARLLFEQSCALFREVGNESQMAWVLSLLAKVSAAEGDLTVARALSEESLIRGKGMNGHLSFVDIAPALEGLAAVVAAQGEPTWAARLWGGAQAQREAYGLPLAPVYRADYDHAVAAARDQLGEQIFVAARAEGRTMTVDQVLFAREAATMPMPAPATHPAAPLAEKSPSTYPDGLAAREVEVLCLVAQGLTNAQIAEELVISLLTVKAQMRSLYKKLDISSRSAATRYAIEHHLI